MDVIIFQVRNEPNLVESKEDRKLMCKKLFLFILVFVFIVSSAYADNLCRFSFTGKSSSTNGNITVRLFNDDGCLNQIQEDIFYNAINSNGFFGVIVNRTCVYGETIYRHILRNSDLISTCRQVNTFQGIIPMSSLNLTQINNSYVQFANLTNYYTVNQVYNRSQVDSSILGNASVTNLTNVFLTNQSNIVGDFNQTFNSTTLVIDANKGFVGLGIATPNAQVHIVSGLGTLAAYNTGTILVLQNNAAVTNQVGLALVSGTSGISWIDLGDSDNTNAGRIVYNNLLNIMTFLTNNSESGRFDQLQNFNATNNISAKGGTGYLFGNLVTLPNTTARICGESTEGYIYYDGTAKKHFGCNSTNWYALY